MGTQIGRQTKRDVLIENDFKSAVQDNNPGLTDEDINTLIEKDLIEMGIFHKVDDIEWEKHIEEE